MRRSIATHLMDNGADINFVKDFLGHVLLDTTHIYSKRRKQRANLNEVFRRHTEEPKPKAI
jgi:site-specific recombinase XerD